jgi:acyl-CoA thioesterase I
MNLLTKIILFALLIIGALSWLFLSGDKNADIISEVKPRQEASQEGVKIIAFGDSLTAGYGLPVSESYPAQLQVALDKLGLMTEVINSGVSGETTKGNLERAKFIRSQNPDIVLLGIGGNDALRLLPIDETIKNFAETINILKSGDNPPIVIILQMQAPLNAGLAYKKSFDAMYEDLASKNNVILLPFLTAELFFEPEYKLSDGIHFNQAGYRQAVELYILPTVSELVKKLQN